MVGREASLLRCDTCPVGMSLCPGRLVARHRRRTARLQQQKRPWQPLARRQERQSPAQKRWWVNKAMEPMWAVVGGETLREEQGMGGLSALFEHRKEGGMERKSWGRWMA